MRNKKGVTLIEVLMTLGIIGMMISPVVMNFTSIRRTEASTEDYVQAVYLAQEKMELMLLIPYPRLRGDYSLFSKIFANVEDGKYANISNDEEMFYSVFTDAITEDFKKKYEMIDQELRQIYQEAYGLKYEYFPRDYVAFRRICQVEEKKYENQYEYKEITVTVFDDKKNRELIKLKTIKIKP